MKKIIAILLTLAMVFCLVGCNYNETEIDNQNSTGRMTLVYNDGFGIIYVDNETGCQYFSRSSCGTCLMVDENGKPLIYKQEREG